MIRMPWNDRTAPNIMLEVTDACNIDCAVCYKSRGQHFKTIAEIEKELTVAMRLRKLHTVTLSGGEPLLHPDLCRIVRLIKRRGFHVFLLTNGVCLDARRMHALKQAGLDSILFHVDAGQRRPDVVDTGRFEAVRRRLTELIDLAHREGLDVSMSVTLMADWRRTLDQVMPFFMDTPELTFLFLAKGTQLASLYADRAGDRSISASQPTARNSAGSPGNWQLTDVTRYFEKRLEMAPFCYIPGSGGHPPVWISYFIPLVYENRRPSLYRLTPTRADGWLMELPRLLRGRYIHKTTQKPLMTLVRILVNALARCEPLRLLRFLKRVARPSARLQHKIVVYDQGPYFTDAGELVHCAYCPTALLRDGAAVPCCVADYQPHGKRGTT